MPEPTANDAAEPQDDRSSRALRRLVALLALILVPAGIYAFYVLGQIEYIRQHNLRSLESAVQAAESLFETTRVNVENLLAEPAGACMFFQRQKLLTPVTGCASVQSFPPTKKAALHIETDDGRVEIVGSPAAPGSEQLRIEISLAKFLEQIPFGAAFDQMLIVDDKGALLGSAISPQRSSPMLPPRQTVRALAPPMRVLDLAKLTFVGSTKDAPITLEGVGHATFVQSVELGGTRYTLMCQPWRVALGSEGTWRLCGLVDGQRSFRQALEVAPQVVMLLLVLLTLAIVSWPILKVLSLAPRERISFADLYLMLLASLTLVIIFAVAAVDIGTYAHLRERSRERLTLLARQIEQNLVAEFGQMYDQLRRYDADVAANDRLRTALAKSAVKSEAEPQSKGVGCMLLPPGQRQAAQCQGSDVPLAVPDIYEPLESIFWMRPCDGLQIIKGAVRRSNTPAVKLSARGYFQAIKRDRLWRMPRAARDSESDARAPGYFVDTSASITTGEFFAALSMPSQLAKSDALVSAPPASSDCYPPEDERVGVTMTVQPVSVRYPVLAPGVGFAIADQDGRVLFHSDERRAVVAENLLADDGLADRVRAALAAGAPADFGAQYGTRPYQIHIRPMQDMPWSVVTFADDEILRTLHIELLAQTGILVTLYLALALIGTLIYILFHGRTPPIWVWPRRQPLYRATYCAAVWSLGAQLILFLLTLDLLRGATLVFASMLLPLPALLTVVAAARAAQRLTAQPPKGVTPEMHRAAVDSWQLRMNAILIAAAALVLVGAFVAMPSVAASQVRIGTQTWVLGVLLVIAVAVATVGRFTAIKDPSWMRWWRDPLGPHIIGTTIIWLLLGALPAYGLYKFALGTQMTLVTKAEQAYVGRAFAWRDCQIQNDFRQIPTPDGAAVERRIKIAPTAAQGPGPAYSDIYPGAALSRGVEVAPRALDSLARGDDWPLGLRFWEYLANVAPVYNETTTYSRYLGPFVRSEDARWSWRLASDEPKLVYSRGNGSACDALVPSIASRLPMREPHFGVVGFIFSLAGLSLLFAWVGFGSRKLFFGDIDVPAMAAGRWPIGSLQQPPDSTWLQAEVEPLGSRFSRETLAQWCDSKTYPTRRVVLDRILEQVRPYYESQWQTRSEEEKLLLIQLAEEGYANPKQAEVVRRLLQAGLLRLDPVLRPMNQSFALFVAANTRPEQVRKQEQAYRGLRWSLVRTLLIAALLLIMVFLALTQRDVVEVWIAYLGTAGAGTIGVLKLLSLLNRSNAPKPD